MQVQIYYVKGEEEIGRDRYLALTHPLEGQEVAPPKKSEYDKKWQGAVLFQPKSKHNELLETIYSKAQNAFNPNEFFKGRSMMVGDIVVLGTDNVYMVDKVGFKEVEWDEETEAAAK